jgi:hypothetical protein
MPPGCCCTPTWAGRRATAGHVDHGKSTLVRALTGMEPDRWAAVPRRRLLDLARAGMAAKATALRRQAGTKRWATVAATVAYLQGKAIDDALELLDLLMVTELLGKAEQSSDKEKLRTHPRLARASVKLAQAVSVLFEVTEHGGDVSLDELWEAIEVFTPRRELHAAMQTVEEPRP